MFSLVASGLVALACIFALGYVVGNLRGRKSMANYIVSASVKSVLSQDFQDGGTCNGLTPMSEIPENGRKVIIYRSDTVMDLPVFKGIVTRTVNDIVIKDHRGVRLWSTLKAHDKANGWRYL